MLMTLTPVLVSRAAVGLVLKSQFFQVFPLHGG